MSEQTPTAVASSLVWHDRTHAEIRDAALPSLPDGLIYGWMTTAGTIYAGEGYPVPPRSFSLDNVSCAALLVRRATPTPAPDAVAEGLRDAMENDPFADDIPLMGTTQQSQRIGHYVSVVLAALPASHPVADVSVYVPGQFRCAKCGFVLVQSNLNAHDGTITARDAPGDRCPNDGAPLWRMTWKDDAMEAAERCIEQMDRAREAEAQVATLTARVETLEGAITDALKCTPQIGRKVIDLGGRKVVPAIIYDCGDPWAILRAAIDGDPAVKPSEAPERSAKS